MYIRNSQDERSRAWTNSYTYSADFAIRGVAWRLLRRLISRGRLLIRLARIVIELVPDYPSMAVHRSMAVYPSLGTTVDKLRNKDDIEEQIVPRASDRHVYVEAFKNIEY